MDEVQFWTRKLREAEAELDAAKTRTALDAAAKSCLPGPYLDNIPVIG
jgi:hypothetical protein